MAKKKHYACYHSCKCMYMSVSKDDSTNEINNSYWTQQYNIIRISAINFNTHVCISLLFSWLYMGGGYWTIYRNNLENHLLLSSAGLDEYTFIAFCCWLGCILQEGCSWAELRTSFGEKLQIRLGSICQNRLDGVHIFWNAGPGSIKKFKSSISTCLWG